MKSLCSDSNIWGLKNKSLNKNQKYQTLVAAAAAACINTLHCSRPALIDWSADYCDIA